MSDNRFPFWCQTTYIEEGANVPDVIKKPHHPSAESGVTISAGYDMKRRSKETIEAEMLAAGVPATFASRLREASTKTGADADTFCTNNADIVLTEAQVEGVFRQVYPTYVREMAYLVVERWRADWQVLPTVVKQVLVDMRFRGDLNANSTPNALHHETVLKPWVAANDYASFRGSGARPNVTPQGAVRDDTYWAQHEVYPSGKSPDRRTTARGDMLPETVDDVFCFPVDLGHGFEYSSFNVETYLQHTERDHPGGYFPIGANTIWHGGLHVHADRGAPVVACATGTVVAARMADGDEALGEFGSRNFVLIRHELEPGQVWYSLVMHLDQEPLDAASERIKRLPWLRDQPQQLQPGFTTPPGGNAAFQYDTSGKFIIGGDWGAKVSDNFTLADYSNDGRQTVRAHVDLVAEVQALRGASSLTIHTVDASGEGCVLDTRSGLLDAAKARLGQKLHTAEQFLDGRVYVSLRAESALLPFDAEGRTLHVVDAALLDDLRAGLIVRPNRTVAAGDILGYVGEYGSPGYEATMIHWEVFSAANLFAGDASWTEIVDDDEDFTIDAPRLFELVPQDRWGLDPLQQNLEPDEVEAFYRDDPKAADLRRYACKFCTEWGPPDLDLAIEHMKLRWFTRGLREKLERYLWWSELQADGHGDCLPDDPRVWHYNPVTFLEAHASWVLSEDPATAADPLPATGAYVTLQDRVGEGCANLPADVQAVKQRFVELGYDWLTVNTTPDEALFHVIHLFQSIKDGRGGWGGDGQIWVDGDTHQWLNAENAPRWEVTPLEGPGFSNYERKEQSGAHQWAPHWMSDTLRAAGQHYATNWVATNAGANLMQVNEFAIHEGGQYDPHETHQTGLNCDVRLPKTDGTAGTVVGADDYDRDACRAMLQAWHAQDLVEGAGAILLEDDTLIAEGLCVAHKDHTNHFHVSLKAPTRGPAITPGAQPGAPAEGTPTDVAPDANEAAGGVLHEIQSGEYLSLIALNYGVDSWETIYYHPSNAEFRAQRPNPDLVYPGDVVYVPLGGAAVS